MTVHLLFFCLSFLLMFSALAMGAELDQETRPVRVIGIQDSGMIVEGIFSDAIFQCQIKLAAIDSPSNRKIHGDLYDQANLPKEQVNAEKLREEIERLARPGSYVILRDNQTPLFWNCFVHPLGELEDPDKWKRPGKLPPSIQESLILSGHSSYWRYLSRAGDYHATFLAAEQTAKKEKRGFWKTHPEYMLTIANARATESQRQDDLKDSQGEKP
jgi:hypothetical protein